MAQQVAKLRADKQHAESELHRAAKAGDAASLERLLASSTVSVDLQDAAGETALQVAVAEGHMACG